MTSPRWPAERADRRGVWAAVGGRDAATEVGTPRARGGSAQCPTIAHGTGGGTPGGRPRRPACRVTAGAGHAIMSGMERDRLPVTLRRLPCPHCGTLNDAHSSGTTSQPPTDGDASVCWNCGDIALFVAGPLGLALRAPTSAERADILTWGSTVAHLAARQLALLDEQASVSATLRAMRRR
jgi:hypothetical protein